MNKLIKVILCIAAACTGAGCAAVIVGLALGGTLEGLDGSGWVAGDATATGGTVEQVEISVDDTVADAGSGETVETAEADGMQLGDFVVDADAADAITLHIYHGELKIKKGEAGKIRAYAKGNAEGIMVSCAGGLLQVLDERTGDARRKDVSIVLEIPKKKRLASAEIKVDAGVVEIADKFTADTLAIVSDAAELTAEKLDAENFACTVNTGVIEIEDSKFGNVKLDCKAGTADVAAKITGDADISCSVGAVDVELENDADDIDYELSCGVGAIEIGEEEYTAISGTRRLERGGTRTFTLNCGLGSIAVDFDD